MGANNVCLLTPEGQFGTRAAGGKDVASPRYINTFLPNYMKALFPDADALVLVHQIEVRTRRRRADAL